MTRKIISILFFFLLWQRMCHCQEIIGLNDVINNQFVDTSNSQNKTYQLEQSIFNKTYQSFYIEMEIQSQNGNQDDNQILFALSQIASMHFNTKTQHFEADFIDKRGYFMKKKYFRIDFEKQYLIDQNRVYLTIYQNAKEVQELKYQLTFGFQDDDKEKKCPFDCLSQNKQGMCNQITGICQCQKGYFDVDCSRKSINLDAYRDKSLSSPFYFTWNINFTQKVRSAFFYGIFPQQTGYLYLSIKKREQSILLNKNNQDDSSSKESQKDEKLHIFYTSESHNNQILGVADQYFAKEIFKLNQSQLISGEEIFLENFNQNRRNLINEEDSSGQELNNPKIDFYKLNNSLIAQDQIQLLFGFRYEGIFEGEQDISEYDIILQVRQNAPKTDTNNSSLTSNVTILVMSIVLIILIIILIILAYYLHKRTQLINIAISTINNRKSKKELEFNSVIELIPVFKYTEEIKQSLSTNNYQEEEPTCPVCLCEFEMDEDLRKTYCPHYFHADCLQEWLKKQKNCPHCRNSLTPRTMKERADNSNTYNKKQLEQLKIIKSPKKNKEYVQQIDEISINMSKISKKSSSPSKSPKKTSPDKSPKKVSPPKSPLKHKQADISEVILPRKQSKLKKKRTKSFLSFSKCDQSKGFSMHKLEIEDMQLDDHMKHKSETHIQGFKEVMQQSDYHGGVTIATEIITQMGDKTNTNLKNRSSILSSGMSSVQESLNRFNNYNSNKSKYANKLNLSQMIRKSDSLFEND